jgi:ABC-type multidrug transport system fused ATPase/permease subunit
MDNITVNHQRQLLEDLARVIAERAHAETSVRANHEARDTAHRQQYDTERQRLSAQYQRDRQVLQTDRNESLAAAVRTYEAGIEAALQRHDRTCHETARQAERAWQDAQEESETNTGRWKDQHEQTVREAARRIHEFKEKIQERRDELQTLDDEAQRLVRRRRCRRAARRLPELSGTCRGSEPLTVYAEQLTAARDLLAGFELQPAARFLASGSLIAILLLTAIAATLAGVPLGFMESMSWMWVIISGAVALGVTSIIYVAVRPVVVRQTLEQFQQFRQAVANANNSLEIATKIMIAEADSRRLAGKQQLDTELRQAAEQLERRRSEIGTQREARLKDSADQLQAQRQTITATRQQQQNSINQQVEDRLRQLETLFGAHMQRLEERHGQETATNQETFQRAWQRLAQRWTTGLQEFESAVDAMHGFCQQRFPDWQAVDWRTWSPRNTDLPALRFGAYSVRLDMFENGLPEAEDLRPVRQTYSLPAVLSFSDRPSLLLEAWGDGRVAASRAIQNAMLRLLTSLPPSKVQFTIIDPVGLGQNFSAFMHLADFDEALVNHRIWTESAHIQQRLVDLTQHMEDVIQTYLRNEYTSINEYNRHAGEVAEPFQVLVVANFPAGFSDEAAQRLLSIVTSGARCGVYTLISTDSRLDLPRNFHLVDLEAHAATLQWNGTRFCWLDEELKDLPLELDEPPDDQQFTEIIREIGKRAKEASRVEVPFAMITPPETELWSGDSRGDIEVALGRAGATKLQYLRLGKGTAQHVLISGKTGSGKSTLLHVLITNTALKYGPEEVQYYLIDFKKGVEFKPYAAFRLPHARVIAIESEREFGMSVLERLDLELRQRGDLFRECGVQDIRGFRDAHPHRVMPRILLIIDEFQEFFVQDDKLAQEAALLLDRLVRQGRAFGIHVLLGSQTLAGAYSLARSTLGQMAVRIALQCSEADSHLILSEDNTAARLLRRPGEAIYNDANGLFEGNHPFQIVWLAAADQEQYLRTLSCLAATRRPELPVQIVFEGNVAANPRENELLASALVNSTPADRPGPPLAWLGAAVAIKEPTSVTFARQSGGNLLVVGQQEELALGVLTTSLIGLAATGRARSSGNTVPRFRVLDGTRPESPDAGFWQRLGHQLSLEISVGTPSQASTIVSELSAETARRQESGNEHEPPLFLIVFNLPRFRELRRADDDFGFSSFSDDKPQSAGQQFTTLLREGPAVGVHTLIWCDTFSNASRWMDRQTLRDLDHRVLFQMSATDSANLMDSPAASRLGVHRALLYSEEQGRAEKFRPYGTPSADWLAWVEQQVQQWGSAPGP